MTHLPSVFAALSDPTRFAIVERLLQQGELPVGRLTDLADISAPAISRHLRVLREAGVIRQRAEGQRRLYSATPDTIRAISAWTGSYRAFWEGSLDRLEATIQNRKDR